MRKFLAKAKYLPSKQLRGVSRNVLRILDRGGSGSNNDIGLGELEHGTTGSETFDQNTTALGSASTPYRDATELDSTVDVEVRTLDRMFISASKMISSKYFPLTNEVWDHHIPYLFPGHIEPTYTPFGIADKADHPGKPSSQTFYDPDPLSFNYTASSSFSKSGLEEGSRKDLDDEIVQVSKLLYD